MHDIRTIRDNPNNFDAALKRRGIEAISDKILNIDHERRAKITSAETALAERNTASKMVGAAKASGNNAEFESLSHQGTPLVMDPRQRDTPTYPRSSHTTTGATPAC